MTGTFQPCRQTPLHSVFAPVSILLALACTAAVCHALPQAQNSGSTLSDKEIIHGIDVAVAAREEAIASYTVKDHYAMYRNGATTPSAEKTVEITYKQGSGKTAAILAESGSFLLRSAIINRVLASELAYSANPARASILITSANYEIRPESAKVQKNGRECLVVDLKALRKSSNLLNGKAWIDAVTFNIVRLEGAPSQDPSVFVGAITLSRDYAIIDGLNMAVHAEAHAHSFLFGTSILNIDSTGYQIQRTTPESSVKAP